MSELPYIQLSWSLMLCAPYIIHQVYSGKGRGGEIWGGILYYFGLLQSPESAEAFAALNET